METIENLNQKIAALEAQGNAEDEILILKRQRLELAKQGFRDDPGRAAARSRLREFEDRAVGFNQRVESVSVRLAAVRKSRGRALCLGEAVDVFSAELKTLEIEDELLADAGRVYRDLSVELTAAVETADRTAGRKHGFFEPSPK